MGTWLAPASGGMVQPATGDKSVGYAAYVTYAGGYWFALASIRTSQDRIVLRLATDPSGDWDVVTLPAVSGTSIYNGVQYTDGVYWFYADYDGGYGTGRNHFYYATDPTGTWTKTQALNGYIDGDTRVIGRTHYGTGSTFVVAGTLDNNTYSGGFIAEASSLTGTWTAHEISTPDTFRVAGIGWDGTQWGMVAALNSGSTNYRRYYASTLGGTWTIVGSEPNMRPTESTFHLRQLPNGVWTMGYYDVTATANKIGYADDLATTFATLDDADVSLQDAGDVQGIAYGAGTWKAYGGWFTGQTNEHRISSLKSASPTGVFAVETDSLVQDMDAEFGTGENTNYIYVTSIDYGDGYFVAGCYPFGQVVYQEVPSSPSSPPTYLRQRQSPKRTPARVRGVDLRQRQTTFIR